MKDACLAIDRSAQSLPETYDEMEVTMIAQKILGNTPAEFKTC